LPLHLQQQRRKSGKLVSDTENNFETHYIYKNFLNKISIVRVSSKN